MDLTGTWDVTQNKGTPEEAVSEDEITKENYGFTYYMELFGLTFEGEINEDGEYVIDYYSNVWLFEKI